MTALMGQAQQPISKWSRFEKSFESTTEYANPVQQAALTVTFTSPKGGKLKVPGFWDGGKTWRARFAPGEEGKWTFETVCSDANNAGLHKQTGTFNVGPAQKGNRFAEHGAVRVADDGRYFVHADGTLFFFLSDTAWNGALLSTEAEWNQYIKERTRQKFSAVQFVTTQWRASPKGDRDGQLAFTGKEQIEINPRFFQRLDAKVNALNDAGLLAVPVLLWAIGSGADPSVNPGHTLPDDQAILLARYMVARWSGNSAAWFLAGDSDYRGARAVKWHRIGRGVFNDIAHGPVTMHPGGMQWVWKEFIEEKWFDFLGYQSGHGDDDKTMRWLQDGPLTDDWTKMPHKPFVNLEPPYENHLGYQSKKPHSPESVRRAVYWSLLDAPTAGVTYGGHGVWGWDDGTKPPTDHPGTGTPLAWSKALTMPGGEQMKHVYEFFTSFDYQRLRPAPVSVVNQPGAQNPAKYIAAAKSDQKDLMVLYIPEDRSVEVKLNLMPDAPNVTWVNPRTGERSPAVAVVTTDTCQFPTPTEGDWILFMKTQTEQKTADVAKEPEKK
jgi:Protein of unknown function (DUF4038)/Domain of unknown function (DUF5060)/Putative collagen-binding domain of a collagenase